jgi:ubiquinone/menaquinone biosynthesis C-methylase UbiE
MSIKRIPLIEEPISGQSKVAEYDRYAGSYMLPEYKYFVRKILKRGIRSGRVLDIGTGSGRLAIELARIKHSQFEIVALDISSDMLRKAQSKASQAGVGDRIEFVLGSASFLPFAEESFDLVLSYASLHHWKQPVNVFNEIQRVIKPGGTLIIRDNRRIYGDGVWEPLVRGISCFMTKARRENWRKVILSSYTIPEVKEILKKSRLENYQVITDFVGFDISIETTPKFKIIN